MYIYIHSQYCRKQHARGLKAIENETKLMVVVVAPQVHFSLGNEIRKNHYPLLGGTCSEISQGERMKEVEK